MLRRSSSDDTVRKPPGVSQILLTVLSVLLSGCAESGASPGPTGPGILIEGALVLDGTGAEGVVTDVRIQDGRIDALGDLSASEGDHVIDASGLVLAPGFIDTHSHSGNSVKPNHLSTHGSFSCVSFILHTIQIGSSMSSPL